MPKLNIAHHKSYHPYRLDNIERVRKDEEEARLKEEREEGRMMLADSEARLDLLRQRSGTSRKIAKERPDDDMKLITSSASSSKALEDSSASLISSSGHINFFATLESTPMQALLAKPKVDLNKELEKGFPLAPNANDLKPWYVDKELKSGKEKEKELKETEEERRLKDSRRKSSADPLQTVNAYLSHRSRLLSTPSSRLPPPPRFVQPPQTSDPALSARLTREASERARAAALIERKRRELEGTDSSIGGDTPRGEYGNVFNKKETREAGERRREWDRERDRDRDRDRERDNWRRGERR